MGKRRSSLAAALAHGAHLTVPGSSPMLSPHQSRAGSRRGSFSLGGGASFRSPLAPPPRRVEGADGQ